MAKPILMIPDSIRQHLQGDPFDAMMQLQGKAFRDVPGRKTMQVHIGGKSYFIKQHFGVGWGEIFKNLITFKKPILGAMTEVAAIQKLDAIGIPNTPLVAYGQRGCNPATMRSFVLTEDLGEITQLDDWFANPENAGSTLRTPLIEAVSHIAKKLHAAGLCHRDFYLCHFVVKKNEFVKGKINLHLIDLHRMLQGQSPDSMSVMKDIAALMFSGSEAGFTASDWVLFQQHYLSQSEHFWRLAERRAEWLRTRFNSDKFQARLAADQKKLK